MKIIKKIGIAILVLAALAAIIGMFMPSKYELDRSMDMKAAPSNIFAQINTLKNWEKWSPWLKMDPTTVMTYNEIPSGKGAVYNWTSKKMGNGTMTVTESQPDSLVVVTLDFKEQGAGNASFTIAPKGNGVSTVTWKMWSDIGSNPFTKLMYQMMKGMMNKSFDDGLSSIRDIAEKMPAPVTSTIQVELKDMTGGPYLFVHDSASIATIGQKLGMDYGQISAAMNKQGLKQGGAPFAIYYTDSQTNWVFDAAIPVDKSGKDDGAVKNGAMKAGKAVVAHFFGNYSKTPAAHEAAHKFIAANGKKMIGAPWEVYVTDPMTEKDTAKWATDVCYPVE